MDVPPVIRNDFVYRDTLFVNVGEGKRHPRASTSELNALLLPEKGTEARKDQVAHWYEAQLLHYGLPRSKDKNTAKMRLLQAITREELKVPADLAKMEVEMKKEYAGAIRKAKLAVKAQETAVEATPAKGKKRKADEQLEPESTKITVKADGMTIHIERSASTSVQATPRKTPAKPKAPVASKETVEKKSVDKEKPAPKEKSAPKAKQPPKDKFAAKPKTVATNKSEGSGTIKKHATVSTKKDVAAIDKTKSKTATPAKKTPATDATPKKQPAKRGGLANPPASTRPASVKTEGSSHVTMAQSSGPQSRPRQTARRGSVLASSVRRPPPASTTQNDTVLLTGVWDASCPELESLYPQCVGNLRLFLCADNETGKLWGGFNLAFKEGIFMLDTMDRAVAARGSGAMEDIKYRVRDLRDGSRTFHRFCVGHFGIKADGTIAVGFHDLFPELAGLQLTARRRSGPLWCGKSETRFQEEWDAFVQDTYGRSAQGGEQSRRVHVKQEEEDYGAGYNDEGPHGAGYNDEDPYGAEEEEDRDPYEDYEWDDYEKPDEEDQSPPKFGTDIDAYNEYYGQGAF